MKIILTDRIVKKAAKYYALYGSLSKTSIWLQQGCPDSDGCPTESHIACTRHPLSRIFREHNIPINPPNGRRYGQRNKSPDRSVQDPIKRWAAKSIYLAFFDIKNPDVNEPENYLSACFFVTRHRLYELMAEYVDLNPEILPHWVDKAKLEIGADLYLEFIEDEDKPFHYRRGLWEKMIEKELVEEGRDYKKEKDNAEWD